MPSRTARWTPAEPEAPDHQDQLLVDFAVEAPQNHDVHAERLRVSSLPDLELVRVRVDRVDAAMGSLPGARVRDVHFAAGDLSNIVVTDASVRRVRAHGLGAVGIDISGSRLEDVRLVNCKLRPGRGLGVSMTRCVFEDCDLREADLEGALLDRVVFRGCDLSSARLSGVDLSRCDLRGSNVDGLVVSPDRLRGVLVDPSQLPTFASALGLRVQAVPAR